MLTHVQKETLQTLINLYQSSNGKSVKGLEIAETINKNPGTIRNQMISLRRLDLVKSAPGPDGGYTPTMKAYNYLNISRPEKKYVVPIYKNGKKMVNVSVAKIEFTRVPQPNECEATIKVLGSIKDLNLGDEIMVGPTSVNNLGILGTIVGRDDMDNIILVDAKNIRSIPKQTVGEIANRNIISLTMDCSIIDAAKKFIEKEIDGAPVMKDGKVVGMFTLTDLINAIANNKENENVGKLMSTNVFIVNENLKIVNAIDLMLKKSISRLIVADNNQILLGILTRTDLMYNITNFK